MQQLVPCLPRESCFIGGSDVDINETLQVCEGGRKGGSSAPAPYQQETLDNTIGKLCGATIDKDVLIGRGAVCSVVQCSAVQCCVVQYSAVQCSGNKQAKVQWFLVQCRAVQCSAVPFILVILVQFNALQFSSVQCSKVLFSAVDWEGLYINSLLLSWPCVCSHYIVSDTI